MDMIFKSDLRPAQFMYDNMDTEDTAIAMAAAGEMSIVHPFYIFKPFRGRLSQSQTQVQTTIASAQSSNAPAAASSTSASSATQASILQLHQPYVFHHLVVEKGNCRPHLPDKLCSIAVKTPLSTISAASSRSNAGKRTVSSSSVNNVTISSLSEQFQSLESVLPNELKDEEVRFARIIYRPLAVSFAREREETLLLHNWQEQLRREGDLDVIFYVQQTIEMVQASTQARQRRLSAQFYVDIPDLEELPSVPPVDSWSDDVACMVSNASVLDNESLYGHVYQSIHGDSVYLHPLCLRALQTEAAHQQQQRATTAPSSSRLESTRLPNMIGNDDVGGGRGGAILPTIVVGKIIDIEYVRLGATSRDKPVFLRHLPAFAAVSIVEINMKPFLSESVYAQFEAEFSRRQDKRREKKKVEQRHERVIAHKHRQREAAYQESLYQPYVSEELYIDELTYLQHFPREMSSNGLENSNTTSNNQDSVAGVPVPPVRFAEVTQVPCSLNPWIVFQKRVG
jgi:hypothetical protein